MPLQSGSDRGAEGDAPLVPAGALPRHHRPGPRRDARRGDHHRHHRRLPRRDRGRLRSRPCDVVRAGAVRRRLHLPVLHAAGHAGRGDGRTRCRKSVVQERYERLVALAGGDLLGGEQAARSADASRCWSPRARGARTTPRTGAAAGPRTTGWCTSPPAGWVECRGAARRRGHGRGDLRGAAPPHGGRPGARRAPHARRRRLGGPRRRAPAVRGVPGVGGVHGVREARTVGLGMPSIGPPAPEPTPLSRLPAHGADRRQPTTSVALSGGALPLSSDPDGEPRVSRGRSMQPRSVDLPRRHPSDRGALERPRLWAHLAPPDLAASRSDRNGRRCPAPPRQQPRRRVPAHRPGARPHPCRPAGRSAPATRHRPGDRITNLLGNTGTNKPGHGRPEQDHRYDHRAHPPAVVITASG